MSKKYSWHNQLLGSQLLTKKKTTNSIPGNEVTVKTEPRLGNKGNSCTVQKEKIKMAEQEEIKQVISEEITKQLADIPGTKKEDPLTEEKPEKESEDEMAVKKEKELPQEIQKCTAMGIDEEKCWNIAGIFGYPREGAAEQQKLSDDTYSPATQEDAVEMIETRNQQIAKLQSGQQNNSEISKELETVKAKLCAAEQVIEAVRKAELEKYTEEIKKSRSRR